MNEDGTLYDGEQLMCYDFIMKNMDGANYVLENRNGELKRAYHENNLWTESEPYDHVDRHESGSGNGAVLYNYQNRIIDVGKGRFTLMLAGYDAPRMNAGETITLTHDGANYEGVTPYKPNGYVVPEAVNYGTVYKFVFKGFQNSDGGKVRMKVRCNKRTNNAGNIPDSNFLGWAGDYVTVCTNAVDENYYNQHSVLVSNASNLPPEVTMPWEIPQGREVVVYVVGSGMSAFPFEISFEPA